jgi:hypothetical protein
MPRAVTKSTGADRTATTKSKAAKSVMPGVPAAAVMSFLKDTRGLLTWTTRDLAESLRVPAAEAANVIPIMEMQGYVKAVHGKPEWLTTPAGQTVSGSKQPRFTPERIASALAALKQRIAAARKDSRSSFQISKAVAFGDFLSDQSRVQAPDVGIELSPRKLPTSASVSAKVSATENKERLAFLKQLRGKNAPLNLQPYQEWMIKRSHGKLF